jgi:shikimate dehydrogenase
VTGRRFAVVGDPVAHSRSPAMHAAAYRALGLEHRYEAVRASADDLPRVVAALRDGAYDGLNITVPHKQRVLELVDGLDVSARAVGAANTLVRTANGRHKVTAYNTDAPALAAELRCVGDSPSSPSSWSGAHGLVLGSGGTARAAIAALADLGVRTIVVRARGFADPARRDAFVRSAPAPVIAEPWRASATREAQTLAVVQATSAGMKGADPGDVAAQVVDWSALPDEAIAIDVIYEPRDTPFLREARKRGLRCDDGRGMLARQGALAFELWLGQAAPLDAMRAALG